MDALQAERTRLTEEVRKNPDSNALRVALDDVTEKHDAALAELQGMTDRATTRQEAFTLMNSPATGGLLIAGILLTYLIFSKRR